TRLTPASSSAFVDLASIEFLAGDREGAERDMREAIRLEPSSTYAAASHASMLQSGGHDGEAWQEYRRSMTMGGVPPASLVSYDAAVAAHGIRGFYETWLPTAKKRTSRFLAATIAARSGHPVDAMELLRQSVERREPASLWIAVHPTLAALRGQPEFAELE